MECVIEGAHRLHWDGLPWNTIALYLGSDTHQPQSGSVPEIESVAECALPLPSLLLISIVFLTRVPILYTYTSSNSVTSLPLYLIYSFPMGCTQGNVVERIGLAAAVHREGARDRSSYLATWPEAVISPFCASIFYLQERNTCAVLQSCFEN